MEIFPPDPPDWKKIILDLRGAGIKTSKLSINCGLESSSLRHYAGGDRKSKRMEWSCGQYLLAMHAEFVKNVTVRPHDDA
jgi:hypothetical protein